MNDKSKQHPIVMKTRYMLKNRPHFVSLADIEKATGLKQSWLMSFANNSGQDSAASKVITLYEYFTSTTIEIKDIALIAS